MSKLNVAIIGATGMVGRTIIRVLEDHGVSVDHLILLASERSAGSSLSFHGADVRVELLQEAAFDGNRFQYALFAAGGDISRQYARLATDRGITVIDNSSAFRMDPRVPLVIPEVNPKALQSEAKLIANPNCSTIQSVLPLAVIDELFSVKRVIYNTYQAVSGSGVKGREDLAGTRRGQAPTFYPRSIAESCLPHIDDFLSSGYTKEEEKMMNETKKILAKPEIQVTATCVRVPIANGHAVSMNVTCEEPIDLPRLLDALEAKEGIRLLRQGYPVTEDVNGTDLTLVGRVRLDDSEANSINLWCVADNIRKGAATNAVQILERLVSENEGTV